MLSLIRNPRSRNLLPQVRRYSCKVDSDGNKRDGTLGVKALTCFGQETGTAKEVNLGRLQQLKKEIRFEDTNLRPLLVSEVEKGV